MQPDTKAPILVIAAMAEEAAAVAKLATEIEELPHPFSHAGISGGGSDSGTVGIQKAEIAGREIILLTTGIGTAAASAAHAWAAATFKPRAVFSVGSCGGLARDIKVGDVVLGSAYAYSIADATAFGYARGQVPGAPAEFIGDFALLELATAELSAAGTPFRSGLMLSGDAFVVAEIAEPMLEKFPQGISADMESTAHAHIANSLNLPFLAVRAVSDLCSPRAGEEFHIGLDIAAGNSAKALARILQKL